MTQPQLGTIMFGMLTCAWLVIGMLSIALHADEYYVNVAVIGVLVLGILTVVRWSKS